MKLFVPGRICLFGEHSDWAGGYRRTNAEIEKGYAIIVGTNQGIYAEIEPHPNALVLTSTAPDGTVTGPYEIPMTPEALLAEAETGSYWSYSAGVAYQILTHYRVRGLVINNYKTDLPIKKGLSSSAAICVLTARAFNRIYDLKMTVRGEMEMAYQGEILTPSRCGRLDQGCAFGNRPVKMTFDGDRLDVDELSVKGDVHLVIVDLHAQKDTKVILARLNDSYPFARTELEQNVQQLFGPINKQMVHQAVEALAASDAERLGALMTEAQTYFNQYATPACPEELTAPVLNRVLNQPALAPHIYGGKGVGSQGDGTAQFVARSAADQDAIVSIVEGELGMSALKLTLSAGAKVRKAVIPVAGFAARMFPASKAATAGFLPVIDRDGIAKPTLLLVVEEALSAGVEEVIIIVQPGDLPEYEAFFSQQVTIENYNRLSPAYKEYARHLLEIGQRVRFVVQSTQEGLGHAVWSAREAVGSEPFLLILGDHIYRAHGEQSCARQMIDAFEQYGTSVIGLRHTPEAQIGRYGAAAGDWLPDGDALSISRFIEKPTLDEARENLRVEGLPDAHYLTAFGQYVIRPQVFDYLEEHIHNNVRERGDFQLTSALDRLRQEDGFMGIVVAGQRFDLGQPDQYLETLQVFASRS